MSIDNSITATRVIMGIKNALADWAPSSIICHILQRLNVLQSWSQFCGRGCRSISTILLKFIKGGSLSVWPDWSIF